MSARHRKDISKKACMRCRHQKRRCDRAVPECGLCLRLHQTCEYEGLELPPLDLSRLTPSPSPRVDLLSSDTLTPSQVKDTIIEKLGSISPEEVSSEYTQSIDPWFPIISYTLQGQLPSSWNEASLDFTILCLCIIMLSTNPPPSSEYRDNPSRFKALYLCTKSWISLIEGFGANSLELVQARSLVTLFEVAHGLYPAAYISIAATVRAADALGIHPSSQTSPIHSSSDEAKKQEAVFLWCGIHVLDRCIAIESGSRLSLTRLLTPDIHDLLKETFCPTLLERDCTSLVCRLSRLFEASTLLDKMHTTLQNPTAEHMFNVEEVLLLVNTSINLQTILMKEIGDENKIYSGGLELCNTGLLLAYENGSKVPIVDEIAANCNEIAATSLTSLLTAVTTTVEPFVSGAETIDFSRLPPFIIFLVYKTAALVTERLLMGIDSNEGLKRLRILRTFLRMVSARWLCCERYLELLNDDTTPRILKSIEQ
ncbi:hypothetical protein BGW36DRAFT_287451 [Talaromyces proteolyticus]|uniref:Zn(2)-C6 fungal-type domain-containing protein n=1 Tax=Talaromyces proteolyticus TaxID=1131652 RepID=A0AAD4KYE5_9EURO|nr:uncharacterized protein BGW36DRAFT_287451 [Talaromyces proteolyticus]KAH8703840.1 hypothetical protein BGW36DRAFT_287451 [Talaromyces proteolyticus]